MAAPSGFTNPSYSFLTLDEDIRKLIYEELFHRGGPIQIANSKIISQSQPNILRTCKAIYEEALDSWHKFNRFQVVLDDPGTVLVIDFSKGDKEVLKRLVDRSDSHANLELGCPLGSWPKSENKLHHLHLNGFPIFEHNAAKYYAEEIFPAWRILCIVRDVGIKPKTVNYFPHFQGPEHKKDEYHAKYFKHWEELMKSMAVKVQEGYGLALNVAEQCAGREDYYSLTKPK